MVPKLEYLFVVFIVLCVGCGAEKVGEEDVLLKMEYLGVLALDHEVCCGGPIINFDDFVSSSPSQVAYRKKYFSEGYYGDLVRSLVEYDQIQYSFERGEWLSSVLGKSELGWDLSDPFSREGRNLRYYLIGQTEPPSWQFIIVSNGPDMDADVSIAEVVELGFEQSKRMALLDMGDLVFGLGASKFDIAGSDFDKRARAILEKRPEPREE